MHAAGIIAAALLAVGPQGQPQETRVLLAQNCTVDSVEPEGVIVASRVPGVGFLLDVKVQEGDTVAAGQTLAILDKRLAEVDVKLQQEKATNKVNLLYAEATRDVAELAVTKMEAANERVPRVFPEMEIRQAQLESIRAMYQGQQAEHQMKLDRFELERARIMVEYHEIKSPVSGIVRLVSRHTGEPVRQGDQILTVLRTDRYRVKGNLNIEDYYSIRKGQRVEVKIVFEHPDLDLPVEREVYRGHVVAAFPSLTGKCEVIAEVDNHNGLLVAGLQAEMRIYLDEPSPRLGQVRAGRGTD